MEQTLHIIQLYESIDRGIRQHEMTRHQMKLADLTEGSQWLIDECEGQESYDEPNKIIRLKWVLTVDRLTDDQFDFTFCDRTYTLNRHWQVLGTEIYRIPNPYMVELVRYVMYFGADEGDKSEYPRLKELGDLMMENEYHPWKNIPMAREALHLLKDRRKCRTATQAKAFCKKVLSHDLISPTDTPRLYLSYLDYYHRLLGSAYYKGELTDRLLNAIDPEYSDEEFLDDLRDSRQKLYDPVQRTPKWEEIIYDVEQECDEQLQGIKPYRGFCHKRWGVKKEILAKYDIDWKSPARMNPRIRFD